jgi:eukaryotic-like serine/threonine-protein kinase
VVDFGIARLTDAATITSGLIGTPSYVAPEQLAGARPTSAVDIFAWAVTMVYAATGRLAFGADSVPAVMHRIMYEEPDVSGLPPSLREVVRECLDKDPARRPSARDLLLRLVDPSAPRPVIGFPAVPSQEALADSVPPTGSLAPPAGPTYPGYDPTQLSVPGRTPGRSRRVLFLAAGGAAAVALIVVAVLLLTPGSPAGSQAGPGGSSAAGQASSPAGATTRATQTAQGGGPTIPAAFAGTWKGTATMSAIGIPGPRLTNDIEFTFVAGARTVPEKDQSCVNTLTLTTATDAVLTFSEPQTPACVAGTVTFTRRGANLAYRWTDNIEQNTATLRRS